MEKQCCKCKQIKDISEFDKKGNSYQYHCKECRREYIREHYNKNKKAYKNKANKNNKKYKKRFNDYKETLNCKDCGLSFKGIPYVCDFHHLNASEKEYNLGILSTLSWDRILKEINKCIPLCSNCHRIRTFSRVSSEEE